MQLGSSTRGGRIAVLLAVGLACLAVPALATAKITVPPGSTEGDQYFEEVPDGGGSGSVNHGGGVGGGPGGGGTTGGPEVAATQTLDQLGADGKSAAALANDNRPPTLKLDNGKPTHPSSSSTEGEGGMGFWFPLLIGITAVAAIAYGLRRRLLPAG
jgi:hypothetical protein